MTADSKKRSETIATPVHDPRLLERAGWTNAEVIWEQIQEAAAECERADDYAEASELWRGALDLAREHLPSGDLRVAASVANIAVAERRTGDPATAKRNLDEALALWDAGEPWVESLKPAIAVAERRTGDPATAKRNLDEALALWDAGEPWVESLKPAAVARSSTFHLRLQAKHPGGYDRFPRERYRTLAMEGRAVLAARRDGLPDKSDRLDRWRRERSNGFNDWRKLLGAVLLIAADAGDGEKP